MYVYPGIRFNKSISIKLRLVSVSPGSRLIPDTQ